MDFDRGRRSLAFEKVDAHGRSNCSRQKGLACPWRAVKQYTFRWINAHPQEELGVLQREFNDLCSAKSKYWRVHCKGEDGVPRVAHGSVRRDRQYLQTSHLRDPP
jgi:hypothetical protein